MTDLLAHEPLLVGLEPREDHRDPARPARRAIQEIPVVVQIAEVPRECDLVNLGVPETSSNEAVA
ncbi:MAG: hypothetical protein ABI959_10670 [Candidatus Dormiibacterota bacterium]